MEDIVIAQGTGVEPVPAVSVTSVSGIDMADVGHAGSEPVPPSPTGAGVGIPSGAEQALIQEVHELWAAHGELLTEARRSEEEALAILAELGRRLSGEKERLARPGRSGGWSSFTRSAGLTRTEADGLVRRYRRTLKPQGVSSIGTENATVTIGGNSAAAVAGDCPETAGEPPAHATATGTVPQPSGEAPGAIAEPAVETGAASAEDGQAAEAAEGVSGGDVAPVQSGPGAAVADAGSSAVA
jgi:hypothetical protein